LPQADAAIQQMETARATLQTQRDRLRPDVIKREETEIERVALEATIRDVAAVRSLWVSATRYGSGWRARVLSSKRRRR